MSDGINGAVELQAIGEWEQAVEARLERIEARLAMLERKRPVVAPQEDGAAGRLAQLAEGDPGMIRAICFDRALYKYNDGLFRGALYNMFLWAQQNLTAAQVNDLRRVYLDAMEVS